MKLVFLALALVQPHAVPRPVAESALTALRALPIESRWGHATELAAAFIQRGDCSNALAALSVDDHRSRPEAQLGTAAVAAVDANLPCARQLVDMFAESGTRGADKWSSFPTNDARQRYRAFALYTLLGLSDRAAEQRDKANALLETPTTNWLLDNLPERARARLEPMFKSEAADERIEVPMSALPLLAGTSAFGTLFDELAEELGKEQSHSAMELIDIAARAEDLARAERLRDRLSLPPSHVLFDAYWSRGDRAHATALLTGMEPDERGLPISAGLKVQPREFAKIVEDYSTSATPQDHATYFRVADASGAIATLGDAQWASRLARLAFKVTPANAECPVVAAETLARVGASLPAVTDCRIGADTLRGYAAGAAQAGRWHVFEETLATLDTKHRSLLFRWLVFSTRDAPVEVRKEVAQRIAAEVQRLKPEERKQLRQSSIPDIARHFNPAIAFDLIDRHLTSPEQWEAFERTANSLNAAGQREAAVRAAERAEATIAFAPDPVDAKARTARLWALLAQPGHARPLIVQISDPAKRIEPLIALVRYYGTEGFVLQ